MDTHIYDIDLSKSESFFVCNKDSLKAFVIISTSSSVSLDNCFF